MKVWIPGMFTQAHRTHEKRLGFEAALEKVGVHPVANYFSDCDLAFIGDMTVIAEGAPFHGEWSRLTIPIVQYVWDLYECNVHGSNWRTWQVFIQQIIRANRVLVPGNSTMLRVKEYAGKDSHIVKAPVHTWELPEVPRNDLKGYVVDVMRWYPDPNSELVTHTCHRLGIPILASKTRLPWDEFRHVIAGAKLLVSAYKEASTGGLTLIEGLWHGVPSLVSDSPYNGVSDYIANFGQYFTWSNPDNFEARLVQLLKEPPVLPSQELCRDWIIDQYSEETFALNLKLHFEEVLSCRNSTPPSTSPPTPG